MPWAGPPSSISSPSCCSACMSPPPSAPASSRPRIIDDPVIFGALMGAIVWNVITWLAGIPSSVVARPDRRPGRRRPGQGGLKAIVWTGSSRPRPPSSSRRRWASSWRCCWCWSCPGSSSARGRRWRTRSSAGCSSSRPRSTRSAMAATTPRRPWASSRCCSTPIIGRAARSTCRSGSCCPARRPWRWAPSSAAGASCAPWARRSPV